MVSYYMKVLAFDTDAQFFMHPVLVIFWIRYREKSLEFEEFFESNEGLEEEKTN